MAGAHRDYDEARNMLILATSRHQLSVHLQNELHVWTRGEPGSHGASPGG